jgi:hypothetical protein
MWEPGTHVVCIREGKLSVFQRRAGISPIVKGKVYTVRRHWISRLNGEPLVQLQEIINPVLPSRRGGDIEGGYHASCFRPLKKLKTEDFLNAKAPKDKSRSIPQGTSTQDA